MPAYAALLRAVNVGGTGKLPMTALKALCAEAGFDKVETYIASGNVVFQSNESAATVQALLEAKLLNYFGKPIRVHIRSRAELQTLLSNNPFPQAAGNRHIVIFLDGQPTDNMLVGAKFKTVETLALGERAIHIHYPEGQGTSKLKIPGTEQGTGRNLNTVMKLIEMLTR